MLDADGPVVTMHVWRVTPSRVPAALGAIARDRHRARRLPGLEFAKLLGTGGGRSFSVRDMRLTQWAMVASWVSAEAARDGERSAVLAQWRARSAESWQATLRPIVSRGRWSGREPFGSGSRDGWDGPVAAITRARLNPRWTIMFWRAIPAVAGDLRNRPGLRLAFGIGEAPIGVQGTFSVWRDAAALRDFAYTGVEHRTAIRRTAEVGWYAEQLFTRFAVLDTVGTIDGSDPLAAG